MAKERMVDTTDGKKVLLRAKEEGVKIVQSFADGTGRVYGFGNDQQIYIWHHSFEFRGQWVLHINFEPSEKKKDKGKDE